MFYVVGLTNVMGVNIAFVVDNIIVQTVAGIGIAKEEPSGKSFMSSFVMLPDELASIGASTYCQTIYETANRQVDLNSRLLYRIAPSIINNWMPYIRRITYIPRSRRGLP